MGFSNRIPPTSQQIRSLLSSRGLNVRNAKASLESQNPGSSRPRNAVESSKAPESRRTPENKRGFLPIDKRLRAKADSDQNAPAPAGSATGVCKINARPKR